MKQHILALLPLLSINSITMMGALVRVPELKTSASGTRFTQVSVSSEDERGRSYLSFSALEGAAERISTVNAGTPMLISARLEYARYADKEGVSRESASLLLNSSRTVEGQNSRKVLSDDREPHYTLPGGWVETSLEAIVEGNLGKKSRDDGEDYTVLRLAFRNPSSEREGSRTGPSGAALSKTLAYGRIEAVALGGMADHAAHFAEGTAIKCEGRVYLKAGRDGKATLKLFITRLTEISLSIPVAPLESELSALPEGMPDFDQDAAPWDL